MTALRRRVGRLIGARQPALQVGALCVDGASGQVLMITSRGTGRWIIPKGWPMAGLSLAEAALQEAWEEAGVRAAAGCEIGFYHYDKMQSGGFGIPVKVRVFLTRVDSLADEYPERDRRERRWIDAATAAGLVAEPELAGILRTLDLSLLPAH